MTTKSSDPHAALFKKKGAILCTFGFMEFHLPDNINLGCVFVGCMHRNNLDLCLSF